MRPYLGKGIPEMGLIPIDPFKIRNLTSHVGSSDINLDLQIIDAMIYNLSNFTVSSLDIHFESGELGVNFELDNVDIEGNYILKGKVLTFTIDGKGVFTFNATGVSAVSKWFGVLYTKNGQEHLNFTEMRCKININDMRLHAYDLFEGNDVLTETVNQIINDNIQELKNDFDVVVEELIGNLTLEYFFGIYDKFPIKVLFPVD
ncbi:hypothetical protein FQR65_LT03731 [Abscondita terminalis]|nr:hypothetical protein FQR65_LT03731 [Abscondita terminalis]